MTAVSILLLLSLAPAAFPQCSWTPRFSGQFRTTALDVAVDNDFLWLATGYGVQLFRRGGDSVTSLDSVAIPGSTRVVRANGSGLAYAGSGTRLYVLRRNGTQLEVVRSVETGGTVQDIHASTFLYVATSKGIAHYDLVDPANPSRTNATFATSSQNVSSIAVQGSTLWTADGDSSVEVFNISIPSLPQRVDTISSVSNATAVHATSDNFLFVSDRFGQNTDVISGKTRLARIPVGASSFAPSPSRAHFLAGPDRTLRAIDFTSLAQPAELFEYRLPVTDGTDNVIHAIARSSDTVYVAAGDLGLAIFDVAPLARPYPLVSYGAGATTSVFAAGDRAWFAGEEGTITEQRIDPQGLALTQMRSWTGGTKVHDVDGTSVLASNGTTATIWASAAQPPTATLTVTFPASVTAVVLRGNGLVALLDDGSVWTAADATPQKLAVPAMADLVRSGSAIALMQLVDNGTTVIRHYANGDLAAETRRITVTGGAIGGLALDATRAALFLFNGVNVIDLATGVATPVAGSNGLYPTQLAFAGDDLLVIAEQTLFVYDDGRTLARTHPLPGIANGIATAGAHAAIATNEGMLAIRYLAELPVASLPLESNFYTKLLAAGDRVYLFSRDGVDIYMTASGAPHYFASVRSANLLDVAANAHGLFALSGGGNVTAYSHAGAPLAQMTLDEGTDMQPLSIVTAGDAVWVSLSKGCRTGACERKTLVLDPHTLAVTDTMTGQVVDVAVSGTRAYALTDFPDEMRVLNIADPLHPAPVVSAAAPSTARSIAFAGGKLHLLGDRVYTFTESTLTASGTFLSAVTPTQSHALRIAGNCAIVTGRAASPELFDATTWNALPPIAEAPSAVRGVIATAERVLVLTDHSLEVWTLAPPPPAKRRTVR